MKKEKKLIVRLSICIGDELDKDIADAAEKLDVAKQDAIRLMLRIGLKHLENVDFDIAKTVLDKEFVQVKNAVVKVPKTVIK